MSGILRSIAGLLTVLIICSTSQIADGVDGRLFFLAYPDPSPGTSANGFQEIHISGMKVDGKVRVEYKPFNKTEILRLNSTNKWAVTLTIYPDLSGPPGLKLPASIIISAEMDISVQTNKAEDGTGGGYLALPITSVSTEFYMASYTPRGRQSQITIAAPYDTCIDIRYYNGPTDYRMMFLSLPPGSVYHINSTSQDFTGVNVLASKPIAVYSGLDCAYVPFDAPAIQSCDYIVEQMPPTTQYGKKFILSSFYGRNPSVGIVYRVVATFSTTVQMTSITYVNGQSGVPVANPATTVVRGQYTEGKVGQGSSNPTVVLITCSTACLVMQYNPAYDAPKSGTEESKPDEFMITVPDLDHYTKDITFSTSRYYVSSGNTSAQFVNGITVVCKKSDLASIMLDGTTLVATMANAKTFEINIPAMSLAEFPQEIYVAVHGSITPGFHTVTSNSLTAKFMVYVYGHAPTASTGNTGYGYLAGFKYLTEADKPVVSGPYFDFTEKAPVVTETGNGGQGPAPSVPVPPGDYPNYGSIWELKFYTLVPTTADLKTRNCSEAYYRYYLEKRFNPTKAALEQKFLKDQNAVLKCAPGILLNFTNLIYYSQFTDGRIRTSLSVYPAPNSTVTMNELFQCWGLMADFIAPMANWCPPGVYKNVTDFLKNDEDYTRGCDVLHTDSPNFVSDYYGWVCPTKDGKLGASGANVAVAVPLVTLVVMLFVQMAFVKYLR
jgi:hypothetical protein